MTQPLARKAARTCAGCHAHLDGAREGSFRVVLGTAGDDGRHAVAVDLAGGSFGRGAHVHASQACLAKACAGGFARAFRRPVSAEPRELAEQVVLAAGRRIQGLLLGARRAGFLAFGEEARTAAEGALPLVVVARDAGGSATGGAVRQCVAEGRAVAWGTKEELGRLFSRESVALVAVRHLAVAEQLHAAVTLAEGVAAAASSVRAK